MKQISIEEQIEIATEDVKIAMIENMNAGKAEVQANDRKKKAHYALQQANARLRGLQEDMYSLDLDPINNNEVDLTRATLNILEPWRKF